MNTDKRDFIIALNDACKTHSEWLCVIDFGKATLLDDSPLFFEVIVREAAKLNEQSPPTRTVADEAVGIFKELELTLNLTKDAVQ